MAATLRLHSMSPVSKEQKTAERYMLLLGSLPLRMRRLPSPSQVCVSPVVGHRPVLCVYEGGRGVYILITGTGRCAMVCERDIQAMRCVGAES